VTANLKALGLIWTSADDLPRERGKRVHLATQYDDEGTLDRQSVAAEDLPYLAAWIKFKSDTGFVIEAIEETVFDEVLGVGGTIDRRGFFPNHRKFPKIPAIVDIKAGQVQPYVRLQTVGYGHAWISQMWRSPSSRSKWFLRCAVGLRPNGKYFIRWFDLKDWHRDLNDWRAVVRAANWKRLNGLEAA